MFWADVTWMVMLSPATATMGVWSTQTYSAGGLKVLNKRMHSSAWLRAALNESPFNATIGMSHVTGPLSSPPIIVYVALNTRSPLLPDTIAKCIIGPVGVWHTTDDGA